MGVPYRGKLRQQRVSTTTVLLPSGRLKAKYVHRQLSYKDTKAVFLHEESILHYWIIGKNGPELEHYGYAEYLYPSDGEWTRGYVARTNGNTAPWLDKAKEELGFDF